MGDSVAVIGDVTPTGGSSPYAPADSGSWSPTTVTYSSCRSLKASGTSVIHEAQCTFVFSGIISSTGIPVTGEDTVTLAAGTTSLKSGGSSVLVDGDSEESSYGNKLKVKASNPIRTE